MTAASPSSSPATKRSPLESFLGLFANVEPGEGANSEAQGKRLFAIIAIGQSLGAAMGPKIAGEGAEHIFVLLLVSAGIFGVCLGLYNWINARAVKQALLLPTSREENVGIAREHKKLVPQDRGVKL